MTVDKPHASFLFALVTTSLQKVYYVKLAGDRLASAEQRKVDLNEKPNIVLKVRCFILSLVSSSISIAFSFCGIMFRNNVREIP